MATFSVILLQSTIQEEEKTREKKLPRFMKLDFAEISAIWLHEIRQLEVRFLAQFKYWHKFILRFLINTLALHSNKLPTLELNR